VNFWKSSSAIPGKPFPQDPYEQLERFSVGAVFRSWMGKRAVDYRKQFKITKDKANGTAVSVAPWCSATWAAIRAPAWASPAIRAPART